MGFWGRLFSSPKAAKEVVQSIKEGLDALVYTDEEKARDNAAAVTEARNVMLDWFRNSQGRNLSRRFLAIAITLAWLIFKALAVLMNVISIWYPSEATRIQETSKLLGNFSADMTPAVMLILGFYFAAPYMGDIAASALKKFGSRNEKKSPK